MAKALEFAKALMDKALASAEGVHLTRERTSQWFFWNVRRNCYRYREACRIAGETKYDCLSFHFQEDPRPNTERFRLFIRKNSTTAPVITPATELSGRSATEVSPSPVPDKYPRPASVSPLTTK